MLFLPPSLLVTTAVTVILPAADAVSVYLVTVNVTVIVTVTVVVTVTLSVDSVGIA